MWNYKGQFGLAGKGCEQSDAEVGRTLQTQATGDDYLEDVAGNKELERSDYVYIY